MFYSFKYKRSGLAPYEILLMIYSEERDQKSFKEQFCLADINSAKLVNEIHIEIMMSSGIH
jgi:hypothetical protein